MIGRVASLWRRLTAAPSAPVPSPSAPELPPPPTLDSQLATGGFAKAEWLSRRRRETRLYPAPARDESRRLSSRFPKQSSYVVGAADRILKHEFDMLGSGAFVPVDPGRPSRASGHSVYTPIDWYLDPVQGLRFPERVPHQQWNLLEMRPGLADVKFPWELSRSQHWATLGQAYRITGDDRYAAEIVDEHDDFVEANPTGLGVNWTCTMDVAIRAFNWALALELVGSSPAVSDAAIERMYGSLFDHATFIERNLENKYEVTSNHFLSNVVGLYGLGLVFQDLPAGAAWLRSGREWLEQEMRVQILEDGADYESSIPYHRLVTELFLSGARLAKIEGAPLSDAYLQRLDRMVEFLLATTRPDGLLPQVGDADDGRLHIFTDYGRWNPQDARHLTAPAAIILRHPEWLRGSDPEALWEAAWWGCAVDDVDVPGGDSERPAVQLFEHAGVAVLRAAGAYLLVTNGRVGTNGFGNHKHNDLLGFEFHAEGVPLVVDPGSYVYTSNPDARNLFRGTAYHSTLRVDGVEQNDLKPEYLFRLFETSTVEHLGVTDTFSFVEYGGRHTGYTRLADPVTHERTLRLSKDSGALEIGDRVHGGSARHALDWHFHLAPGVMVDPLGSNRFALVAAGRRFRFEAPADLVASVRSAWYSPTYGVRVPCAALDFHVDTALNGDRRWSFVLAPETSRSSVAHS